MSAEEVAAACSAPCIPITFGNIAFQLGKNRIGSATEHSHRWSVFVRGAANQDISYAVQKVVFTLHPTITDHVREVLAPPYQVSETGWGSFEVGIAIYLRGFDVPGAPSSTPVTLTHVLKLFHDTGAQATGPDRPAISETYDEIVVNTLPPDPVARAALLRGPVVDPPVYPHQEHLGVFSAETDLAAIKAARAWVKERMEEEEDRLSQRRAEAAALKKHLAALGVL
jgi:YEATS domain-containing protein 4